MLTLRRRAQLNGYYRELLILPEREQRTGLRQYSVEPRKERLAPCGKEAILILRFGVASTEWAIMSASVHVPVAMVKTRGETCACKTWRLRLMQDCDNILLLASYPKTGSTWVRRTLIEIVAPKGDLTETIPSFRNSFPEDSPRFALMGDQCRIIKTHLHPGTPRFSMFRGNVKAVLTIKRHPLDVLLSSLNYALVKNHTPSFIGANIKAVDQIVADCEMQYYMDQFIERDGFPWHEPQSGAFSRYLPQWRNIGNGIPYLELCFEEMVADPKTVVIAILNFLGRSMSDKGIATLLWRVDHRTRQDGKFYWSRRAYNYESMLPTEMADAFKKRYRHVLENLGYSQCQ